MKGNTPQIVQDRGLAARVAGADQAAFDALFRENFPRLFRFTLSRVNNDADLAEEIVQRKMGACRGESVLPITRFRYRIEADRIVIQR